MSALQHIRLPDIGDFNEVGVVEILVAPGDTILDGQSLIVVESDKATIEIPAPAGGTLTELNVVVGDKICEGALLGMFKPKGEQLFAARNDSDASDEKMTEAPAAQQAPTVLDPVAPGRAAQDQLGIRAAPEEGVVARGAPQNHAFRNSPRPACAMPALPAEAVAGAVPGKLPFASPSIRRLARELDVPLAEVVGTGIRGRITLGDVQGFVRRVMSGQQRTPAAGQADAARAPGGLPGLLPWPQVDFASFGPVERRELSRIQKISGANLHRNWVMIPHVTSHEDADITEVEAFRQQLNHEHREAGVKVTLLAFLMKACVAALKAYPVFNSSLDGEHIVLKQYFHIGFAADTPNGLVVPVIRDVDQKGVLAIAQEMSALSAKARDGRLAPSDMRGGGFSISSMGGIGGTYFTPIINAPEVAILGVGRHSTRVVWNGREGVPRLILPLSLSWDHRVIDGALAGRFNACLAKNLADVRRLLL